MKSIISPWSIYDHLYQLSENNSKIIKKQSSPIYRPSLRKKKKNNNEKQTYDLPIIVGKVTQPESIKEQYINIQKNNRSETHHKLQNSTSMQEVRHKAKKVNKQINSLIILQIIDEQLRINTNQFNSISQKNPNDQVQIKSFPKIKSKENLKISNKMRKMSLDRTPFDDDKIRSKVKRKSKLYIPNQILEFNSNNEY